MNTMKEFLRVENLHTSFFTHDGEVKAVKGVDFHIGEGETLGIVGESGSGKSVTSLSILDLLPPAKRLFTRMTMGRAGKIPRLARGLPL